MDTREEDVRNCTGGSDVAHDMLMDELTELRAFKQACEKQEAVAWRFKWSGLEDKHQPTFDVGLPSENSVEYANSGNGCVIEYAYIHPDPEAASLRLAVQHERDVAEAYKAEADSLLMRVEELENSSIAYVKQVAAQIKQLEDNRATRDQQVAEACAAECEGIDAINSRGWGDVLAKRIRSGEWQKHLKGGE